MTLGHSTARPSLGVTVMPKSLNLVPPPASTSGSASPNFDARASAPDCGSPPSYL